MPRLQLDIDLVAADDGGDPHVFGAVRSVDGTETEFLGWVGLVAVLQRALVAPATIEP